MVVEKQEESKLHITYDNEFFTLKMLDKDFVALSNKLNEGRVSVEKVKSKFQSKIRKKSDILLSGDLFNEAVVEIYEQFATDYGVSLDN